MGYIDYPTVVVVNESKHINEGQAWNIAWALEYQGRWQFGPLWQMHTRVMYLPPGKPVPAGAWILHLLDDLNEPGALGYHDEDGNEVPFSRVGVEVSLDNKVPVSEVASHEFMEMVVDPHVNAMAYDPKGKRLIALEVGDPCQGGAYDVGAPYGRTTGMIVADFVLPSWFDPNTKRTAVTSYRGECKGAFDLGKGGYIGYSTTLPPEWQQEFGEHANKKIADADDRVARRGATFARGGVIE